MGHCRNEKGSSREPFENEVVGPGEGDAAEVVVNPFADFGVPLPAFAQAIPTTEIKSGDLIYNSKRVLGWVIGTPATSGPGKKPASTTFKLLKPDGTRGEWRPAKISSMGLDLSGAMVLRSLVNMLGGSGLGRAEIVGGR